jgi:DNA repair protein RadC
MPKAAPLPPETLARFSSHGPDSLSDAELLALGFGLPLDAATSALTQVGGLFALTRASPTTLAEVLGGSEALGRRVSALRQLGFRMQAGCDARPKLATPSAIAAYLMPSMAALAHEEFRVLCFNARNVLVRDARVAVGTASSCAVSPREVFAPAFSTDGVSAIVLSHNHPSGDPMPSVQDTGLTRHLCKAAVHLGIKILDHVIIGGGRYSSLMEEGLMPESS